MMSRNTFNQVDDWNAPNNIVRLRLEFINKEIEELNLNKDYKDKFIKSRTGSMLIEIGRVIARLKPVTTKMLSDYILGIFGIPISISRSNEKFNIQIENLLSPAFRILEEYVKSDAYRLSLIKQEVSGDEILKIKGLEIPLSFNAILLHIKRTNSLPLKADDIVDIQKDLVDYKKAQFRNLPSNPSNPITQTGNEPKTLFDIWQEGKSSSKQENYDSAIQLLKKVNPTIGNSFLSEMDNKLSWNESIYGNRKYLAAFIQTMIKKRWIMDSYSAPEYKKILENTFIFKSGFNLEPFKSLSSNSFDKKYTMPFENFPSNI